MSGDPFAVIAHMAEEAEHDSSCYGRWLHDYDPYARAGAGDVFGQLFLSAKRVLEFLPSHDPSSANRLEEIRCRCRRQDN